LGDQRSSPSTGMQWQWVDGGPSFIVWKSAAVGDGVDAPRRHLCAKVTVSNCHRRRRPWSRLPRSVWISRSTVSGAWSGCRRACAVSQAHHSRDASRFPRSANPMRRRDGSLFRCALPLQKSTDGKQKLGPFQNAVTDDPPPIDHWSGCCGLTGQPGAAHPRGRGLRRCWLASRKCGSPSLWMARIVWALLVKGGTYRTPAAAA
jgi:hypothetical protein